MFLLKNRNTHFFKQEQSISLDLQLLFLQVMFAKMIGKELCLHNNAFKGVFRVSRAFLHKHKTEASPHVANLILKPPLPHAVNVIIQKQDEL